MKKVNPAVRKIVITFRVNAEEMRELIKKAHQYSYGNISKLARTAALNYRQSPVTLSYRKSKA